MPRRNQLTVWLLLVFLFAACDTPPATPTPYPTYDPFAPVSGNNTAPVVSQNQQEAPPSQIPSGPTPTRAPISVTIPHRDPNTFLYEPTPDAPHPLPTPRQFADQYIVQPGDTLGNIAQDYGISLDVLMEANGLNEASILSVGVTLNIPPVSTDTRPGSSFKIIPDSELIYGPASTEFDLEHYLSNRSGYLSNYIQDVDGAYLTGAQIIQRIAESYSISPRLLLALIEYRSGWVTDPTPDNVDYPYGNYDSFRSGLYRQAAWAADNLNRGYYLWRANAIATLPLADGSYIPLDATINAGTMGVQYFFSRSNDRANWDIDVGPLGLFDTYRQLFGYPFDYSIPALIPPNLVQPAMRLPFVDGVTWTFTGGPHGGWDSGSAWAALDFAPPGEGGGCDRSIDWVAAVADGLILRAENGAVMQDLDNDGYEQTGWNVLYMHVDSHERVQPNTYVYAGDLIGHPSCEGGVSNATHLHLARKYNGEWIPADGNTPFLLDGWVSSGNGIEYDGFLTKGITILTAEEGVHEGINLIAR
jgi:murein DD-endopeptidase MepM/ murein hydrolase activator NlpD